MFTQLMIMFLLSMVAHYCHEEVRKLKNFNRKAMIYKKKIGEYFTFPGKISKPTKTTQTSFWSYQIVKLGKSHDIRLLRKGNNPSVDPQRAIHHCLIEDTNHIVLVKEIQGFIRCVRPGSCSKKKLVTGSPCKICLSHIKTIRYKRHFDQWDSFKYIPNVILPKEGKHSSLMHFMHVIKLPLYVSSTQNIPSFHTPLKGVSVLYLPSRKLLL